MPCPDCIQMSSDKLIPSTPNETPTDSFPFPDPTEKDTPESPLAYRSGGGSHEFSSPIIAHDGTRVYMPHIPETPSTDYDYTPSEDDDDDDDGGTLESFMTFRSKVPSLIYHLGRGRTNSALIEHLGIGITGISYPENPGHGSQPFEYHAPAILRVSRKDNEIQDQVAVLAYLRQLPQADIANLLLPDWYAYDTTQDNEIGIPYVLTERYDTVLANTNWYGDISIHLDVCAQLVDLLVAHEQVRFPLAGRLVSAWPLPESFSRDDEGYPHHLVSSVKLAGLGVRVPIALQKSLRDIIKALLQAYPWREKDRLRVVADEMCRMGFFDDDYYNNDQEDVGMVLWHGDLTPGNLGCHLVRYNAPDGEQPHIRGMMEWSDVCAVPPVLARKPPAWLWTTGMASKFGRLWDGDALNNSRLGVKEDLRVKSSFLRMMESRLPGYVRDALGPRGRWVRTLFDVARHGFVRKEYGHKSYRFGFWEAWETYKKDFWPVGVPDGKGLWDDECPAELEKLADA
jgi:hypothetical protein